jgi:two-component system response regulator (stage 0 sporulation protein F)
MRKTILVVDDEENLRLLCQEVLDKEGYRVIEAEDGIEAMTKIEQETPDLVILDIQMPRMDGMEALPRILRKEKKTPVILYTGHSQYQEEFMAWAADAYVMKSSDFTELKDKVHELLSARGSMETLRHDRSSLCTNPLRL